HVSISALSCLFIALSVLLALCATVGYFVRDQRRRWRQIDRRIRFAIGLTFVAMSLVSVLALGGIAANAIIPWRLTGIVVALLALVPMAVWAIVHKNEAP